MADIELVIKISEDSYKATCNGYMLPPDVENVVQGIKTGIPLPKGHGDLIDRVELLKEKRCFEDFDGDTFNIIHEETVINANTIIEADRESEG